MANFLNRLAARALGSIPFVEPIIPARFSSGPEQSDLIASDTSPRTPRSFSEGNVQVIEQRSRKNVFRPQERNSGNFIEAQGLLSQDLQPIPHAPPPQPPAVVSLPQANPPFFAEREITQRLSGDYEAPKSHPIPKTGSPPSIDDGRRGYPSQIVSPSPVLSAEPQTAPRVTPLKETTRSPALQYPEAPPALVSAPPTIRVSIGRIEVRAEISAPPPKVTAHRPRPSTLSLDEFLKQAGRGGR